jgi:hypothetical protein
MVRRSGFSAFCVGQLLRQLGFAAALFHGRRDPLHLAGKLTLPLFQPTERPFQRGGCGFQPLHDVLFSLFHVFPFLFPRIPC